MRTFTEDEVQDMVTEAFDKGALHGVSWGKMAELPHLGKRRAIATNTCLDIFIKAIRNQDNGTDKYSATMKKGSSKLLIRNLRKMKEQQTEKQALNLSNVVKRTLERKEASYVCVNMWYEKEYDSSTPDDEVASMDKEAAELNAQIKVLRHILSEVGEL